MTSGASQQRRKRICQSNVTLHEDDVDVYGSNVTVHGNRVRIIGANGTIYGDYGRVDGPNGVIIGDNGTVNGPNGKITGDWGNANGPNCAVIGDFGKASGPNSYTYSDSNQRKPSGRVQNGGVKKRSGPSGTTYRMTGRGGNAISVQGSGNVVSGNVLSGCSSTMVFGDDGNLEQGVRFNLNGIKMRVGAGSNVQIDDHGNVSVSREVHGIKVSSHMTPSTTTTEPAPPKGEEKEKKESKFKDDGKDEEAPGEASECVVCQVNKKKVMYTTCNHLCVCFECSRSIHKRDKHCPVCRDKYEDRQVVFT